MTLLTLLPTSALAASSTGTGIKPTSNTNYWTTRLLHDGTPYSYKPPMAAGKMLYCMDRGYGYRWGTPSFLNSYTYTSATGTDADAVLKTALAQSGMGELDAQQLENFKWMMSFIVDYGTDHIGGYGCGPTSMAIVVSSLTSETVDPVQMARWAYEHGYWCSKSGSYHTLIPGAAQAWGLSVEGCTASEPQRILDALADGKLVVALMTKGHFTKSGHFIVLRGVQDEKILVADPASYRRSQKVWDLSIILNEASRRAGAGGPFWIIG